MNNFFADETGEEFNAVGYRNPVTISQFYGPPQYIPPPTQQNHFQSYSPSDGYKYGPPNGYKTNNNNGYNEAYPEPIYIPKPVNNGYDYNNQYNNQQFTNRQQKVNSGYYYPSTITHYNQADNLKRYLAKLLTI